MEPRWTLKSWSWKFLIPDFISDHDHWMWLCKQVPNSWISSNNYFQLRFFSWPRTSSSVGYLFRLKHAALRNHNAPSSLNPWHFGDTTHRHTPRMENQEDIETINNYLSLFLVCFIYTQQLSVLRMSHLRFATPMTDYNKHHQTGQPTIQCAVHSTAA